MLLAAGQLQAMRAMATPSAFRQSARARLLEQISNAPQEANASYWERLTAWWRNLWVGAVNPFAKPAWAGTALVLVLVLLLLTTTTYAAQATIHGDSLYPLKLVSEDVWLRLAANAPDVNLTLAERRLQEARMLQKENRNEALPETISALSADVGKLVGTDRNGRSAGSGSGSETPPGATADITGIGAIRPFRPTGAVARTTSCNGTIDASLWASPDPGASAATTQNA